MNAGGSVILEFIRSPFKTKQSAFIVGWNVFLHVGYINMDENTEQTICNVNRTEIVEPKLWETSLDRNFVNNDRFDYGYTLGSQIIRKSMSIDAVDLPIKFVYLSSSSHRRYQSILSVVLTSNKIDSKLVRVHLTISVEGNYLSKEFHAKENLLYEYEWSRRNAYDQNVHGIGEAIGKSFL